MSTKSNWYEDKDGYHKKPDSTTRGNADYFQRPIPPVTDSAGRPIKNGETDWGQVIEEANKKT